MRGGDWNPLLDIGSDEGQKTKDFDICPLVLEGLAGLRLRKEEADCAERWVREFTGWSNPVKEKTGFVETACQNYEVLVEDKRVGKARGAKPSQRYEIWFGRKQNDAGATCASDKTKKAGYWESTEIERTTDLRKALEERTRDNKVELSLREVLRIAKKEFHDSIMDLVKRKRLSTEPEPEKPVAVRTTHLDDMVLKEELAESYYSRLHWARATTETPVWIGDV